MKLTIKAKNINLTTKLQSYIEEKINWLDKFLPDFYDLKSEGGKPTIEAWVEIERITPQQQKGNIFRVEGQITLPGGSLRIESTQDDLRLAIDDVKHELYRQCRQYSRKKGAKNQRQAIRFKKFFHLSNAARFWRKGRIRDDN